MSIQIISNNLHSVKNLMDLQKLIPKLNKANEEIVAVISPMPLLNPEFQVLTVARTLSQAKATGYIVFEAGNLRTLQTNVTNGFKDGYIPVGGIMEKDNTWRQAAFKYENF